MKFHRAGYNLILVIVICLIGLLGDLALFMTEQPTISELVWDANKYSHWPAILVGVLVGHLFTVPK